MKEDRRQRRRNGGMNFALVRQNSFVWLMSHAYTLGQYVCIYLCTLNDNGMMKDPS